MAKQFFHTDTQIADIEEKDRMDLEMTEVMLLRKELVQIPTPFNDLPYIDSLNEPMVCTDEGCSRMQGIGEPMGVKRRKSDIDTLIKEMKLSER